MKGTHYVIALIVYIASIVLPIIVSSQVISFIHVALYAAFSLIITSRCYHRYALLHIADEGAMALVLGGIIYSYIKR